MLTLPLTPGKVHAYLPAGAIGPPRAAGGHAAEAQHGALQGGFRVLSRGPLGCGTSQDCVEIETPQPGLRGRVSSRGHGGALCTPLRLPLTPALGARESGTSKCCVDPCTSSAHGHACSLWEAGILIACSLSLQVTPGVDGQKASPQEIGAATYKALTRIVPPAVPGQPFGIQGLGWR
jgi:hypothetical protein